MTHDPELRNPLTAPGEDSDTTSRQTYSAPELIELTVPQGTMTEDPSACSFRDTAPAP